MKFVTLALGSALTLGLSAPATAGSLQTSDPGAYQVIANTPYTGFANPTENNFRAKYRFERGLERFEAGDFGSATKEFKKAHRWAKKHPLTNLMLGASLYRQGKLSEARGYIENSLANKRIVLVGALKKTADLILSEIDGSI